MPKRVAVVGAGVSGLTAASELAMGYRVTLLDRLPVVGGVLGYEHPRVVELGRECQVGGVRLMLGTTALRWRDRRLLAAGPSGIQWLESDHLIYAGGNRPATLAELQIVGPRVAGILPATVAIHLAEAGVILGRRIAILGTGDWAQAASQAIAMQGSHTIVIAPDGSPPAFTCDALISGWNPIRVVGTDRITALVLTRSKVEYRVSCDALILAASPRPLRNVEGAIFDGSGDVTFIHGLAERSSVATTIDDARAETEALRFQAPLQMATKEVAR